MSGAESQPFVAFLGAMKCFLRLLCVMVLGTSVAQAQQNTRVVKFNPLGAVVQQFQAGFEYGLGDNLSVQLSAGFLAGDPNGSDVTLAQDVRLSRTGWLVMPEFRYYPGDDAVEGFYLGLLGRLEQAEFSDFEGVRGEKSAAAGALTLGYQYAYDGFMLDLFIGPKYEVIDETGNWSQNWNGLEKVHLGLKLGYGW